VGYMTKKVASVSTIHPSKRPRSSSEPSTNQVQDFSSSTNTEENSTDSPLKRKYQTAKSEAKLVSKVSKTRKASNDLQNLAEEGLDVHCTHAIAIENLTLSDQGCR